jgi:hypothetical protein
MITEYRGTPSAISLLASSPATHASTVTGDLIVAAVHGFWATALGAGTITPPAGFTLIARSDVAGGGTNQAVVAHYVATASTGGSHSHTFTFAAGFAGSTTEATITTYHGGFGITGVHTDSRVAGAAVTYTPTAPTPPRFARGVIGHTYFASSSNPISTANGWSTVQTFSGSAAQSGHILELPDQAPPMVSPVLAATSGVARCSISYAVKAVPDGGFRVGSLGFGPRGSGF